MTLQIALLHLHAHMFSSYSQNAFPKKQNILISLNLSAFLFPSREFICNNNADFFVNLISHRLFNQMVSVKNTKEKKYHFNRQIKLMRRKKTQEIGGKIKS